MNTFIKSVERIKRSRFLQFLIGAVLFIFLFLAWPVSYPFEKDYSRLVFDRKGELLRVTLSSDEQYRFPPSLRSLPEKYRQTLIITEDKRFYSHPGVDFLALGQALIDNLKAGKIIRGGSTITMQVARLADPKKRTYFNKMLECISAIRYDLHFSKDELLHIYALNVPMGKNIVGIESACYYYFGKPLSEITWAEAALLVVLPNDPSRINLTTDREQLLLKRNRMLNRLKQQGLISQETFRLSIAEPLPDSGKHIPFHAPHFCNHLLGAYPEQTILNSTLDLDLQQKTKSIAWRHHLNLANTGIHNLAILIAETSTGNVKAYIGSNSFYDSLNRGQVDGVQSNRSTGSLLKPFLIAKVLDKGPYTMQSKIHDVPTFFGTFSPQNASKTYSGLVTLEEVLINSLNVPSVRLLNTYGLHDFYHFLKDQGLSSLFRTADEYGLTLILGGAEASLWELSQLYLSMANLGTPSSLVTLKADSGRSDPETQPVSAGSCWLTLKALSKLSRPGIESYWHLFNNQKPVAWKTGTSYGQKDGWAIGVNAEWMVGVWTGNFTGLGNPELSGARSAAPILFDLFNMLPSDPSEVWFEEPEYDLSEIECCAESGFPAGKHCPNTVWLKRPVLSYMPGICPYHHRYLVDRQTGNSVCSLCWNHSDTTWSTRFIVPASVRNILIHRGFAVDNIPRHASTCPSFTDENRLEITYPVNGIRIHVPRDLDGLYERVVFSANHQRPGTQLFWYLNGQLIGDTVDHHRLSAALQAGRYNLTVIDEEGFSRSVSFSAHKTGSEG